MRGGGSRLRRSRRHGGEIQRLQLLINQMPAVLWSTDRQLRFTSFMGAGLSSLGLEPVPSLGQSLFEFFRTNDREARPIAAHRRALTGESVAYEGSWWNRTFQVRVEPLRDGRGLVSGVVGVAFDITERIRAEEKLKESEERYRILFERNLAGVFRSTPEGRILECNEACWRMFGCASAAEFLSRSAPSLYFDPADRQDLIGRLREQGSVSNVEVRFQRMDGSAVSVLENLTLVEDPREGPVLIGCLVDITDRKLAEERVVYQAYHDPLTDLPNRLLFADRLAIAIAHAHRVKGRLAVLCLDLDHFKLINDTLGHSLGDRLLEAVSDRLARCVREGDTVARAGGDEFTILLPDPAGAEDAVRIARAILEEVARPLPIDGHELYVTASIGAAIFPEDGDDVETLLKNGDNAMYRAKELGRNTVQLCTAEMNRRAQERLAIENGLRHAPEREELIVYYQPFFDCASRRIAGVEALLRWRRPGIGLVMPEEFVGVAEETRLILPIGEWILATACRQMRIWQDSGMAPRHLAVNLSMRQFQQPGLVQAIERMVRKAGISPKSLELEITESIAMQDAEMTLSILKALRAAGIRIALDDFGTGHASLNHLKRFPITKLKIDRSFVSDMRERPENAAIVRTIIAMAHDLHLKVIAEGVESRQQLEDLAALKCDEVQGYWLAQPMPADECEAVLRSGEVRPPVIGPEEDSSAATSGESS